MKSQMVKRVEALESKLGSTAQRWVVIHAWGNDLEAVRQDKLARWRVGEDVPGAPSDVADRANANVIMIEFVSPSNSEQSGDHESRAQE